MKGHEFVGFWSGLDSLAASATVEIILGRVKTRVSGRRSQYISHRDVDFENVEQAQSGAIIQNHWAVLIIQPSNEDVTRFAPAGKFEMEPVRADVPFAWLRRVLESIQGYIPDPSGLFHEDGELVPVLFYQKVLDHFEKDGRPVYKEAPAPAPVPAPDAVGLVPPVVMEVINE